jgi:hypothetical protein
MREHLQSHSGVRDSGAQNLHLTCVAILCARAVFVNEHRCHSWLSRGMHAQQSDLPDEALEMKRMELTPVIEVALNAIFRG